MYICIYVKMHIKNFPLIGGSKLNGGSKVSVCQMAGAVGSSPLLFASFPSTIIGEYSPELLFYSHMISIYLYYIYIYLISIY